MDLYRLGYAKRGLEVPRSVRDRAPQDTVLEIRLG